MKVFYKSKHKLVLMIVLALLMQIVAPVVGDYVYAEDEKAFSFQVIQQADGSGKFEWKYDPVKANGQRLFEIDLKLELRDKFPGFLEDEDTENVIGDFIISKDGILTATIYETESEELEDPEKVDEEQEPEEPKTLEKMVEIQENKVTINLEVEESLEGQTVKVEILNEDQELVEEVEVEVEGNWVRTEFENLEPGNYLARVTVGEDKVAEEEFEIEEVVVEDDEDTEDTEDTEVDEDESEQAPVETDETEGTPVEVDEEEVSMFGQAIATLAYGFDSLEGMLLADAEAPEEELSGGGFIPLGFMPFSEGGGTLLEDIFTFTGLWIGREYDEKGEVTNVGDEIESESVIVIGDNTQVYLEYAWEHGSKINNGDTATIQLPDVFKKGSWLNRPLMITEDEQVGTYDVVDGIVTFRFDERIEDEKYKDGVKDGVFGLSLVFNEEKFKDNVVQKVDFEYGPDNFNITVRPTGTVGNINKSGEAIPKKLDAKSIDWDIEIVNTQDNKIENATVTDLLPKGLSLDIDDIKIYEIIVARDGKTSKVAGELTGGFEKTKTTIDDKDGFKIIFREIGSYKGYRIEYNTKITDYSITEFINDASFNDGTNPPHTDYGKVTGIDRSDPMKKEGKYIGNDIIQWTITVNKAQVGVDDANVYDVFPTESPKLELVAGSIEIFKNNEALSEEEVSEKSAGFPTNPIKIGTIEPNDIYTIKYQTKINYVGSYKQVNTLINKASLKEGEITSGKVQEIPVVVTRKPIIAKSGDSKLGYDNKTIVWTIVVNEAKHPLTEIMIKDTLPAGLELDKSTVKVISGVGEGTSLTDKATVNDGELTIDLSEIDLNGNSSTIQYTTKITDFTQVNFTNNAEILGTGVGTGPDNPSNKSGAGANTPNNSYGKEYKSIDYNAKTIEWKIEVDPTKEPISQLKITDTFPNDGLMLLENSLVVMYGEVPLSKDNLVEGIKYSLEENGDNYNKGFILRFLNDSGSENLSLNKKITIIYKTSFDPDIVKSPIKDAEEPYKNKARFEGLLKNSRGPIDVPKEANSEGIINPSKDSGEKKGKLISVPKNGTTDDAEDGWISGNERRIQWEVYINYLKQNLGNSVSVKDKLEYEGKIDFDNLEVLIYSVTPEGDMIPGAVLNPEEYTLVKYSEYTDYGENDKDNTDGYTLTFNNEVHERYVIRYTTSVPEESQGSYTNSATTTSNGEPSTYNGKVEFTNYNSNLSKKSIGTIGNSVYTGDEIKWEVTINESLSKVTNGKVVDEVSDGLVYLKDSIKVYPLEGAVKGQLLVKETDYKVDINRNQLTIDFIREIDSAHVIEYNTLVTANKGPVNNGVVFSGTNVNVIPIDNVSFSASLFSFTSGKVNPEKGEIEITKVDVEENTISGTAWEAEFALTHELYPGGEWIQIGSENLITENGVLKVGNLRPGKYKLQEVKAPEGYVLDDEVKEFTVISKNGSDLRITRESVVNERIERDISFVKKSDTGKLLEDVEFTLFNEDGSVAKVVKSNSEGKVTFTGVEYGEYTIEETKALDGYKGYEEILKATISADANGETIVSIKKEDGTDITEIVNIVKKGNIKLKKIDENGALGGATFAIYGETDAERTSPIDTKTSSANGEVKFENIPYGNYVIVETDAPEGYKLAQEIEVKWDSFILKSGEIDLGEVKNEKIKGQIVILKKGEGENKLSDAKFELFKDADGNTSANISGQTGSDGYLTFENVPYGTYYIIETESPEGYLILDNNLPKEVTINASNDKQTQEFTFRNTKIRASIKVKKIGENEKGLAGAEFSTFKTTDTNFETPIHKAVSDEDGIATFTNVEYGEYKIKETKAPEGYNLSDEVLDATITTQDEEVDLTNDPVSNTKIRGNIEILKRNRNTHAALRNAVIAIYTGNDVYIDEKVSGDNGLVRFEDLEYGNYYFQETKAPSGYILNNSKYYFDIEENDVTLEMTLDNTRRYYPPGPGGGGGGPTDPGDPNNPPKEEPKNPEQPETEDPTDPEETENPENPDKPATDNPGTGEPTDPTDPNTPGIQRVPEDPPTIPIVLDPPTKGTITFDEDGNWIYTPEPGATGKDTFTIVHPDGREETITINLDDIALGTAEITAETLAKLPKTGAVSNLGFYLAGLSLIFLGIFLRKRKIA